MCLTTGVYGRPVESSCSIAKMYKSYNTCYQITEMLMWEVTLRCQSLQSHTRKFEDWIIIVLKFLWLLDHHALNAWKLLTLKLYMVPVKTGNCKECGANQVNMVHVSQTYMVATFYSSICCYPLPYLSLSSVLSLIWALNRTISIENWQDFN